MFLRKKEMVIFKEREALPEGRQTIIDSSAKFKGQIHCEGDVRILGNLEGEIETQGALYIGDAAKVVARINARDVMVAGNFQGNIWALGSVSITATGKVCGNITCTGLLVESGAIFNGQISMTAEEARGEPSLKRADESTVPDNDGIGFHGGQ